MLALSIRPDFYADEIILETPDGEEIRVSVSWHSRSRVRVGINAPKSVKIIRQSHRDNLPDPMDDQVVS